MLLAEWAGQALNATQVALLRGHFAEFKQAWDQTHQVTAPAPLPSADSLQGTANRDGFCSPSMSAAELRRYPQCRGMK
jgi:hypothetical protein